MSESDCHIKQIVLNEAVILKNRDKNGEKMQIKQILRYQLVYVLLVILLVAAVIFNINTGNINISPIRIFRIPFSSH